MADLFKINTATNSTPAIEDYGQGLEIPEVNLKKADNAASALEEIQSETFYKTLKSYYSYREADSNFEKMAHADLLEYFYNDRAWR